MSGFLLDTNCISELVRSKPDSNVTTWIEDAEESLLYLSVLTLGEIRKGLASLPQGKEEVSSKRGSKLTANAKAKGKPISTIGVLLAATAIQHDLTLVSRNVGDFAPVPVQVLNPWEHRSQMDKLDKSLIRIGTRVGGSE